MQTYNRMQQAFPGAALPANVVVKAPNVNAPAVQGAISRLREQALASGRMHEPITVEVNDGGTVANIAVPIDGKGTDAVSNASLSVLRDEIVPTTVGAVPGVEAASPALTAQWKDGSDEMTSKLPLVVGFVLVFAFSLMLVAFRSPVIAVEGDRAQPALGRRRLRRAGARLPARLSAAGSSASARRPGSTRWCRCSCS